ncbi:prephenate dehydratase [Methanosarcinales archaeon ex4572_44]|nr:MAG: prephenate dehydratase [Methanosarcinales archaeon ex4572_44]RLG26557.1 MAG: prephenate dehydratase [Methanosarcinales archaeon]
MRVGVIGPRGTFSEVAARKWDSSCELSYFDEISDVVEAVLGCEVDFGVVPIENSIEGSVNITLDLLLEHSVRIVSEVVAPVVHNLLARKDAGRIHTIVSHPQALAQCRRFLRAHFRDVRLEGVQSTARAAKLASESRGIAAIASLEAASAHGLKVIFRGIQDVPFYSTESTLSNEWKGVPGNFTRFVVLGCGTSHTDCAVCKTSLILHLKTNRAGALYELLGEFATRRIDLTRIESRPTKKALEDYLFYIDFKGSTEEEGVKSLLDSIGEYVDMLKVLGSYPAAERC